MKKDIQFIFRFNTYNDALIWNAFEAAFWLGMIMILFFLIAPLIIAAAAELFGLIALLYIWADLVNRLTDPRNSGKNCWWEPDKMKD